MGDRANTPVRPTPGRIVWYQTDGRGGLDYFLPAMVVATRDDNQVVEGFERAGIPVLTEAFNVHLRVYSPGEDYVEHDVPWDPAGSYRSWRWPTRS